MQKLRMTPALKTLLRLAYPRYTGRKYRMEFAREITLYDRDWSGGTHCDYVVLRDIGHGIERAETPMFRPSAPADQYAPTLPIPPGYVVVTHRMFCGHDCGIVIVVNPDSTIPALAGQERLALPAV